MVEKALLTLLLVEGVTGYGFHMTHGLPRVSNYEYSESFIGSCSQRLYERLTAKLLHERDVPCVEVVGKIYLEGSEIKLRYTRRDTPKKLECEDSD